MSSPVRRATGTARSSLRLRTVWTGAGRRWRSILLSVSGLIPIRLVRSTWVMPVETRASSNPGRYKLLARIPSLRTADAVRLSGSAGALNKAARHLLNERLPLHVRTVVGIRRLLPCSNPGPHRRSDNLVQSNWRTRLITNTRAREGQFQLALECARPGQAVRVDARAGARWLSAA